MFDPTPDGGLEGFDDRYFVLTFPDYDGEAEIKDSRRTELIKILYEYKMIVDNWIPEESFRRSFLPVMAVKKRNKSGPAFL